MSLRKLFARSRHFLAARGLDARPQSDRATGRYSGFSFSWGQASEDVLRGAACRVSHPRGEGVFFVENERDFIQRHHLQGSFYELAELELIAEHAKGGTILDAGANVGNHCVFAGLFLGFDRIVAVEPNPLTARILDINLRLNGLRGASEIAHLGLSDKPSRAEIVLPLDNNLGAARIGDSTPNGESIELVCADSLLTDEKIDFVKMDIEGHELRALRGMQQTLRRDRPVVFVEVERENEAGVRDLMVDLGYGLKRDMRFAEDRSNQLYIHEFT